MESVPDFGTLKHNVDKFYMFCFKFVIDRLIVVDLNFSNCFITALIHSKSLFMVRTSLLPDASVAASWTVHFIGLACITKSDMLNRLPEKRM
jgi:hypothetical protein